MSAPSTIPTEMAPERRKFSSQNRIKKHKEGSRVSGYHAGCQIVRHSPGMGYLFDKIVGCKEKHLELFLIMQMVGVVYSEENEDTCSQ